MTVQKIPDGYHTVTPYLIVSDANAAIDFYSRAFGATERYRMPGPDGQVMHAELQVGNSILMLSDENPGMGALSPESVGGTPASFLIYTEDVDAAFARAVEAGAEEAQPPTDMFWGDRFARVLDPFGHPWALATHVEDVGPEEIDRRLQAMAS